MYTGMRSRSASWRAQPMWSPCSWVTKIASSWSAIMPAAPRRLSSSRMPRPQSISRCATWAPLRAWTTVAFPELPLPRLLNRITEGPLLQVLGDHLHDALRVDRRLRRAAGIQHRHGGGLAVGLQVDPVLQRLLRLLAAAEEAAEEAGVLLVRVRRHVTHEVRALAAVA